MAVADAYAFPDFLTLVLTQLFFSKPPTTFLICFSRGESRINAGKKVRLNRVSNSQPAGHKFNTLTTELPGGGGSLEKVWGQEENADNHILYLFNKADLATST